MARYYTDYCIFCRERTGHVEGAVSIIGVSVKTLPRCQKCNMTVREAQAQLSRRAKA